MADFHEVLFPLDVALGSRGGPAADRCRHARVGPRAPQQPLGAVAPWGQDADALHAVVAFFEERRGRLHGFRFRHRIDWRSGPLSQQPGAGIR